MPTAIYGLRGIKRKGEEKRRTRTKLPSYLRQDIHPRMRAFSYLCSLPVTWYMAVTSLIHCAHKHHGSVFDRTGVIAIEVLQCGNRNFRHQTPVTLSLTQWPSYTNSTCRLSPQRYTARAYMNFLRQGFRKLSSDRQTYRQLDTQTRPKLYTTPLRGWSKTTSSQRQNCSVCQVPVCSIRISEYNRFATIFSCVI